MPAAHAWSQGVLVLCAFLFHHPECMTSIMSQHGCLGASHCVGVLGREKCKGERQTSFVESTAQKRLFILYWLPAAREAGKWNFPMGWDAQCCALKGEGRMVTG